MIGSTASSYGWRTRLLSILVGCAVWEALARAVHTPFLPTCVATMAALAELVRSGSIVGNLTVSLANLVAGFAAAAAVGVGVGVSMGRVRQVELIVEPYLHGLLAAPALIFVPLLFTVFGVTRPAQVGSVFVHAVFVIAAITASALKPKNANVIAMAAAFGATDSQIFWKVRWPQARPLVASGLRVGVLLAVKGMINGEMFVAFTGLGALARTYGARFEADKLMALLIVISAVALGSAALVDFLERHAPQMALSAWRLRRLAGSTS